MTMVTNLMEIRPPLKVYARNFTNFITKVTRGDLKKRKKTTSIWSIYSPWMTASTGQHNVEHPRISMRRNPLLSQHHHTDKMVHIQCVCGSTSRHNNFQITDTSKWMIHKKEFHGKQIQTQRTWSTHTLRQPNHTLHSETVLIKEAIRNALYLPAYSTDKREKLLNRHQLDLHQHERNYWRYISTEMEQIKSDQKRIQLNIGGHSDFTYLFPIKSTRNPSQSTNYRPERQKRHLMQVIQSESNKQMETNSKPSLGQIHFTVWIF